MNTRLFIIVVLVLLLSIIAVTKIGDIRRVDQAVVREGDHLVCAAALYSGLVRAGVELDSQCLGVCGDYSVDIVHVPRTPADDFEENECREYREGITSGFIELDVEGNVVRIQG